MSEPNAVGVTILFESLVMSPSKIRLPPDPVIEAYKKDVDTTLLEENLRLTIEERFRKLMAMQRFAEELQRAGKRLRGAS